MTVHFIGAGPGAPDLITVRGRDLIARCPVCLYAGSLVPAEIVAYAPRGARVIDTAPLTLDAIIGEMQTAAVAGDYRWNTGKRQFNLGLFRGLAGVGYTLLRQVDASLPNVLIWQ